MRKLTADPLRIAEIDAGFGGKIGVTFCPGKKGPSTFGGFHDRDLDEDLDVIAGWNAAAVVTLIEDQEFVLLNVERLGQGVCSRFMEWHHLPIRDVHAPDQAFDSNWPPHSERLRGLLMRGCNVLVHCRGGLGRAGTIAARLLVEMGAEPSVAIDSVRAVRKGSIETYDQQKWVERSSAAVKTIPVQSAQRDRAIGALVGLAVGDAVGTTIEFKPKPARAELHDMVGGGPFKLKAGEWTDDTSMALALADSLIEHPDFSPHDLMNRFVRWRDNGEYSCTGRCFDIGNTVRSALHRFQQTGNPMAGSTDPRTAGNGALMRLSPVAIRFWQTPDRLAEVAAFQTRTTHGAEEAIGASVTFAGLVAAAIAGESLTDILRSVTDVKGGFLGRHRNDIRGSGYVVESLQAALWAVSRTSSFRSAVLLAANLGNDADTTAAIAGQLAGASYGLAGIPEEWLSKLAWRGEIERRAAELYDASLN